MNSSILIPRSLLRGASSRIALILIFTLCVLFASNPAAALVGDSEEAFGLDGSFRAIGAMVRNYDFPFYFNDRDEDDFFQSILRLTAGGRPGDFTQYEIHLVGSFTYSSAGSSTAVGFGLGGAQTRYRAFDDNWKWRDEKRSVGNLWFDRFNVKTAIGKADITIGRQAVTFGKAFFWNPLDVFLPFDPAQFDRDYKPGVDAVRLDIALGDFSGLTFIYAPGRQMRLDGTYADDNGAVDASWYGSALLARWFTNTNGWDLAFQAGKIYGGYHIGGGVVGEISGFQVRAEAAWFIAMDSPEYPYPLNQLDVMEDAFTAVFGIGRRFESSLDIELEFLYNGGGEDKDNLAIALLRQQAVGLPQLGRAHLGLSMTYEFTPLVVGRLSFIRSLTDSSTQVQPLVTWSMTDNSDLLIGAIMNIGDRPEFDPFKGLTIRSEFGSYPDSIFAEYKIYF